MKVGDYVLVKDDYIADLYDEGPFQSYVQLEAGATGQIDHFGFDGEICISFFDYYYVIADIDDFDFDGIFMINYTEKHRQMLLEESEQPLLRIIKED